MNKQIKIKNEINYSMSAIEKNTIKFLSNYLSDALNPSEILKEKSIFYQACLSLDDFNEKIKFAKTIYRGKRNKILLN